MGAKSAFFTEKRTRKGKKANEKSKRLNEEKYAMSHHGILTGEGGRWALPQGWTEA